MFFELRILGRSFENYLAFDRKRKKTQRKLIDETYSVCERRKNQRQSYIKYKQKKYIINKD